MGTDSFRTAAGGGLIAALLLLTLPAAAQVDVTGNGLNIAPDGVLHVRDNQPLNVFGDYARVLDTNAFCVPGPGAGIGTSGSAVYRAPPVNPIPGHAYSLVFTGPPTPCAVPAFYAPGAPVPATSMWIASPIGGTSEGSLLATRFVNFPLRSYSLSGGLTGFFFFPSAGGSIELFWSALSPVAFEIGSFAATNPGGPGTVVPFAIPGNRLTSAFGGRQEVSAALQFRFVGAGAIFLPGSADYDIVQGPPVSTVPEPGTLSLLATGLVGMGGWARLRARKRR